MPNFPDQYLAPLTSSLLHFVEAAQDLLVNDPNPRAFAQFMLSGLWPHTSDDGSTQASDRGASPDVTWYRSFVNARQGLASPVHPTVVGDFDSIIGITKHLPFAKAITWHIIPLFKETLTKNAHIVRQITVGVCIATTSLCLPIYIHT